MGLHFCKPLCDCIRDVLSRITSSAPVLQFGEDVHYTRMGDLETVRRAKNVYHAMSEEGCVQIFKQRMTGCDRQTLENVFNTKERDWGVQMDDFPKLKALISNIRAREWMNDKEEVIERSSNGTQFVFANVQQSIYTGQYNLVLCHLKANTEISENVLIGGMMTEGLLARDGESNTLYLQ